jgi:hypothetical protein
MLIYKYENTNLVQIYTYFLEKSNFLTDFLIKNMYNIVIHIISMVYI